MKARVNAEDCKIKVVGYFHEYFLNFDKGDVLEIEISDECKGKLSILKRPCENFEPKEERR